ncbi:MAG: hypothetical protein JNK05_26915 [Myxococcales bacterium]|nr:hypothetical protein [Myxococcales bacterium]
MTTAELLSNMRTYNRFALSALLSAGLALAACGEPIPPQDYPVADGHGPKVKWDPGAQPFPEVPLPNDYAVTFDPRSPTGVRINASLIAPTYFERNLRVSFSEMDGWGTTMPITVAFEGDINLGELGRRHPVDPSNFTDDSVYLIDLETGVPVPLDMGNGHYPLSLRDARRPLANDPRAGGNNLLFATVDEDTNGDGILQPDEDTNFDGVLQRASPNLPSGQLAGHWDAESRTLVLRPLVPLLERHKYAVVLTSRLVAASGAVRSPFATVAHPNQLESLRPLEGFFANPTLQQRFYGDLRWANGGGSRVQFAWMFTTQTTTRDLIDAYRGLRGEGRLQALSTVPPNFRLARARSPASGDCPATGTPYVITRTQFQEIARMLVPALGFGGALADALVASFDWIEYAAVATYDSPSLFRERRPGQPDSIQWDLDAAERGSVGSEQVQLWVFVPRTTATARPPFPVAFHPHGYSVGNYEALAYAGFFARQGYASITVNAPSHGFSLSSGQTVAARALFAGNCLAPLANAALRGRARDANGDGTVDSGADFLTAQIFRTRDMVRQTVVDYMQLVRHMRDPAWSRPGPDDHNDDGRPDAPGDFNGDGVVDVGGFRADGTPVDFALWGPSLGGITSSVLGAVDQSFTAVAPVSGGGILTDISSRSMIGAVRGAVLLPTLGPVIAGVRAADRPPRNGKTYTSCGPSAISMRFIVQDGNEVGELEFRCSPEIDPGDDVRVFNEATLQRRCTRADANRQFFLPVPADRGDPLTIEIFRGRAMVDYDRCDLREGAVRKNDVRSYLVYEGDCDVGCGHIPDAPESAPARMNALRRGSQLARLTSPGSGVGLRRQTAAARRFMQLAQAALDPGDPVNYAPLYSIRPWDGRVRPIFFSTTAGDDIVPISTGITFARAAGLVPFMTQRTDTELDEYFMPTSVSRNYNNRTAEQLLIDNFVGEGIPSFNRFPIPGGRMDAVFDAYDFDEGQQGFGEATLRPPLRMARVVTSSRGAEDDLEQRWSPRMGDGMSAYANAYIVPDGTHVFLPSDPSQPFDIGLYMTNLVARFLATKGTDLPYVTDPMGHRCMATSSCSWLPRAP